MTQVRMYVGVADKMQLLYVLLSRKILPRNLRAFIFVPGDAEAAAADDYLWTAKAGEFLPHARAGSDAAADSPAVIGDAAAAEEFAGGGGVLISWAADAPAFFGQFDSFADIAEKNPAAMAAARARYKFYQSHGYPIDLHKMDGRG